MARRHRQRTRPSRLDVRVKDGRKDAAPDDYGKGTTVGIEGQAGLLVILERQCLRVAWLYSDGASTMKTHPTLKGPSRRQILLPGRLVEVISHR